MKAYGLAYKCQRPATNTDKFYLVTYVPAHESGPRLVKCYGRRGTPGRLDPVPFALTRQAEEALGSVIDTRAAHQYDWIVGPVEFTSRPGLSDRAIVDEFVAAAGGPIAVGMR